MAPIWEVQQLLLAEDELPAVPDKEKVYGSIP
jgi:hypothetical protein